MKTVLGRSLSALVSAGLVLGGNPGLLCAQAVLAQRVTPLTSAGFAPSAGAAPLVGLRSPAFGLTGPSSSGLLPSIRSPQVQVAVQARVAAIVTGALTAVAAAPASVEVSAPTANTAAPITNAMPAFQVAQPQVVAANPVNPGFSSSIGRAAGVGVAGLARRLSKAPLTTQLSRIFDNSLGRGHDETPAVSRRNAAAPEHGPLSKPGTEPAVQTSAPVPAPAAPTVKKSVWKRNLLIGAGVLSLAGAAVFLGPQFLHFAENFGSDLTLSADLSLGSFAIAFAAGLLSFLSPCTLPLIPAYLSFISGASIEDLKSGRDASWRKSAVGALVFVAGFSLVFTALGATATAMGALLVQYMPVIAKGAGVVVAVMGLHVMGVLKIGLLYREKRADVGALKIKSRLLTAFLMGLAFAFGWAPCIGPILAGILGMAAMGDTVIQGVALLAAYSLGLGVPFILAALGVNKFLGFFSKYKKYLGVGEHVTGALLVIVGLLIFFGGLQQVAGFFGL